MEVGKLEGVMLDFWAAKAYGLKVELGSGQYRPTAHGEDWPSPLPIGPTPNGALPTFSPSTDWGQGGQIIEREHIGISYGKIMRDPGGPSMEWMAHRTWVNQEGIIRYHDNQQSGDTPLIAAMRCFVASKYGAEVPDIL